MLHCYSAWPDQKWKMYCQWRAGVWQLSVLSSSLCWYGDSTQWLATTLLSVLWHYSYTENWFQTSRLAHQAQPLVTTGIPFKLPSPPASPASRTKSNVTWGRGSSSFFTVLVFSSGPLIPSLIIISGLRILQRFDPITLLYPKEFITWVHKFVYRGSSSTLDTRVCFVINSEPHLKRPSSSGTFSMKVF